MTDWQPISTAPKDGTEVLAWSPGGRGCVLLAWEDVSQMWRSTIHSFHGFLGSGAPTHWQPLPPPPGAE